MQDSHEVLLALGDLFDSEAGKVFEKTLAPFSDAFAFEIEERKKCSACGGVSMPLTGQGLEADS